MPQSSEHTTHIAIFNPGGNYGAIADGLPHILPASTESFKDPGELLAYVTHHNPPVVFIDIRTLPEEEAVQLINDAKTSALTSPPRIGILTETDPRHPLELQQIAARYQADIAFPDPYDLSDIVEFARTTFETTLLPANPPEKTASAPDTEITTIPTILIIEDEHKVTDLIRTFIYVLNLESQVNTEYADHGQTALNLLKTGQCKPHLVVVDFFLPDMNGADVIEAILSDPQLNLSLVNIAIQTAVPEMVKADTRVQAWMQQGLKVIDKNDIPTNIKEFLKKAKENLPGKSNS